MSSFVRVGVDTGGTFTDLSFFDERTGQTCVAKVPSTPDNPAEAVLEGIRKLMDTHGFLPENIRFLIHGTTVATNALLEGKGARTALITTQGFEDVLLIGRQNRPKLYDHTARKPMPIVPRSLSFGAPERVDYTGNVLTPLDEQYIRETLGKLKCMGVESIAVSLLHSYANPVHEKRIKALIEEIYPEAFFSLSSEVLPEFREYERTSTICINSYVMPKVNAYVAYLEKRLNLMGIGSDLYIMQSNGGVITAETARDASARTVLSGPAGGALTGAALSLAVSQPDLITIDMGGTSSDICLIKEYEPHLTTESDIEGYPIKLPMIDINTIGAGGGSIAWIDTGGALRVGPASAGAHPGPACYGHGGLQPTVTDANAVLGRINPGHLLGGEMKMYLDRAWNAIEKEIARPLGMDVKAAAEGIIKIVNANMIRGIRRVSVEKGYDLRDFALVPFGGAGPLHGVELAAALNMKKVIVPPHPGIASALGMLCADVRHDYVRTHIRTADDIKVRDLEKMYLELESHGRLQLAREGFDSTGMKVSRFADMRYIGQSYELSVPMEEGPVTGRSIDSLVGGFHRMHELSYGYAKEEERVELVNLRVVCLGMLPRSESRTVPVGVGVPLKPREYRTVFFDGREYKSAIYDRDHLAPGRVVEGPAVVEQMDSTILIPPGFRGESEPFGNLIIEAKETP